MNLLIATGTLTKFETRVSRNGNEFGTGVLTVKVDGRDEEWPFVAFGIGFNDVLGCDVGDIVACVGELHMYREGVEYPRPKFVVRSVSKIAKTYTGKPTPQAPAKPAEDRADSPASLDFDPFE